MVYPPKKQKVVQSCIFFPLKVFRVLGHKGRYRSNMFSSSADLALLLYNFANPLFDMKLLWLFGIFEFIILLIADSCHFLRAWCGESEYSPWYCSSDC